jgi:ferredoxin-NADP reductase
VVLLAGGVGITPIRTMFAAMPGGTGRVSGGITLIYRASHPRDVVDAVSGATSTSEGYIGSLQSALDQARG